MGGASSLPPPIRLARSGTPSVGHTRRLVCASFSRDGNWIVTASEDRTARLWYGQTGKPFATLQGHQDALVDAAFSPDSRRVLTGSVDRTACLWDIALA